MTLVIRMHGNEGYIRPPAFLIEDRGYETPCWIWQLGKDKWGYGKVGARLDGRRRENQAHRWFYEEIVGPIPTGFHLHHECVQPSCVNPEHMAPHPQTHHNRIGGRTKLTFSDVEEIRASAETLEQMAERFGVTAASIFNARAGVTFGAREHRPNYSRLNSPRKIPLAEIGAIRSSPESTDALAARYGVDPVSIREIRRGRTGGPLTDEEHAVNEDRKAAGRRRPWSKGRKLTPEQVRYIRNSDATLSALEKELGVNPGIIHQVRAGRTYRDVV